LTGRVHLAFSTNHLTDIDKTKHNYNQQQHPNFKGHVTPNKDEYKKFVQTKFRYCHNSPLARLASTFYPMGKTSWVNLGKTW